MTLRDISTKTSTTDVSAEISEAVIIEGYSTVIVKNISFDSLIDKVERFSTTSDIKVQDSDMGYAVLISDLNSPEAEKATCEELIEFLKS